MAGVGRALGVALVGLNGYLVEVEADIGQTLSNRRHMTEGNCRVAVGRNHGLAARKKRMDAETLRLLITASGVALSGLGGASVAAYFGRRNTKDTITAAEKSADAERSHERTLERDKWERDKKLDTYVASVRILNTMHNGLTRISEGRHAEAEGLLEDVPLDHAEMRLLAPHLMKYHERTMSALEQMMLEIDLVGDEGALDRAAFKKASDAFQQARSQLERAMRKDLGVEEEAPTPEAAANA